MTLMSFTMLTRFPIMGTYKILPTICQTINGTSETNCIGRTIPSSDHPGSILAQLPHDETFDQITWYGNVSLLDLAGGNGISCDPSQMNELLLVTILKAFAMVSVMASAVLGNLLVIVGVLRYEKLRIIANSFILSMAIADLLVAILVMPFNASQEICGGWMFDKVVCNIFNANDVLFSTASLLHLCCISVDRYLAVTDPLHYEFKMTRGRVAAMLGVVWGASALLSHVPIHMGWYTTIEKNEFHQIQENLRQCKFEVNKIYGIISSVVSFWTPAIVMVFAYVKIFSEARKQERNIRLMTYTAEQSTMATSVRASTNGSSLGGVRYGSGSDSHGLTQHRKKIQRENKAAKTLGIIMGAFLFCWLPFFTWYLSTTMCGEGCPTPSVVIALLFWIGYLNSALNPLIYAFFNRDFREAFRKLLRCSSLSRCAGAQRPCCCCRHLSTHSNSAQMTSLRSDTTELHYRPIVTV